MAGKPKKENSGIIKEETPKKSKKRESVRVLTLPTLPLRGLTVFPHMELHFDIGRDISIRALELAMERDQLAFLVTQLDAREDAPGVRDLYKYGTIARVRQHVRISPDTLRVRVEGLSRGEAIRYSMGSVSIEAEELENRIAKPDEEIRADDGFRGESASGEDGEYGEDGAKTMDSFANFGGGSRGDSDSNAESDSFDELDDDEYDDADDLENITAEDVADALAAANAAVGAMNGTDLSGAGSPSGQSAGTGAAASSISGSASDASSSGGDGSGSAAGDSDGESPGCIMAEVIDRGKNLAESGVAEAMDAILGEVFGDGVSLKPAVFLEALHRQACQSFEDYMKLLGKFAADMTSQLHAIKDVGELADVITANTSMKTAKKQALLEIINPVFRVEAMLGMISREIEILSVEKDISGKVRLQIEKSQRERYLREQAKVIQGELGEEETSAQEAREYARKLKRLALPEEVRKKVQKETDRLSKMHVSYPESAIVRAYLDLVLDLPWSYKTDENNDLHEAERILNEDHYGLEKVKERIIEYLAVRTRLKSAPVPARAASRAAASAPAASRAASASRAATRAATTAPAADAGANAGKTGLKGPILCLVGPPGVGKTSIAKSVARALNRKYVRMSLGGVHDEAEIRGHRRTYIGAIPGRIISAMKQAESLNPLILLDEIDKLGKDFRGDPSAALLETLDGEQNFAFRDHYLEAPYDLSDVMFMTTANNADSIPRPLLDRMEQITVSGYTEEEKVRIGMDFLTPKQLEAHGVTKSAVRFSEKALRKLINEYTREAGVRSLEREIAAICRKSVRMIVGGEKKTVNVTPALIEKMLGGPRYRRDPMEKSDEIGVARGLAWTSVGGETLAVEVNVMDGKGNLELTGQLGDVMRESAKAAVSFVRSRASSFGVEQDFYGKRDLHVHVPEGATPKDGPSAGITIATAMISALSMRPVRRNVAMTGEITLRGRVLPIGGLKEKVLAAHRAGIDTVIVPKDNEKDLEEIPENVRARIRFVFVSNMDEALVEALGERRDAHARSQG